MTKWKWLTYPCCITDIWHLEHQAIWSHVQTRVGSGQAIYGEPWIMAMKDTVALPSSTSGAARLIDFAREKVVVVKASPFATGNLPFVPKQMWFSAWISIWSAFSLQNSMSHLGIVNFWRQQAVNVESDVAFCAYVALIFRSSLFSQLG